MLRSEATKHLVESGLRLRISFDEMNAPASPAPSLSPQGNNEKAPVTPVRRGLTGYGMLYLFERFIQGMERSLTAPPGGLTW